MVLQPENPWSLDRGMNGVRLLLLASLQLTLL